MVAAIAARHPASMVLLARADDRKRPRAVQLAGLGFAAALVLPSG